VNPSPLEALRKVFGDRLEGLAGSVIAGEIPVTADIVNRLLATQLASSDTPISSAEVVVLDHDAFTVHLRPRGPLPMLRVDVVIDRQPELPAQPILGMRWTLRGLGPLAMFAAPVISYLRALPAGIRLEGDRVSVNVEEMLRQRGFADLVPLLTGLRVTTRDRRFVLGFELRR
jgi:hypothetical protein